MDSVSEPETGGAVAAELLCESEHVDTGSGFQEESDAVSKEDAIEPVAETKALVSTDCTLTENSAESGHVEPVATGIALDMPLMETGVAPKDPELENLRKRVQNLKSEQSSLREKQREFNSASEPYKQVDQKLSAVSDDLQMVESKLFAKEQSLGDYIKAEKQFIDAERTSDTVGMLAAHDTFVKFMQRERDGERWGNALLSSQMVVHAVETVRKIEKTRADALDKLRAEQISVANEVVAEIKQSNAEFERSQLEMQRLQNALKAAQQKLDAFEKSEAKDLKTVDEKYADVLQKAAEQLRKNAAAAAAAKQPVSNADSEPKPRSIFSRKEPTPAPTPAPPTPPTPTPPPATPPTPTPPVPPQPKKPVVKIPTSLETPFSEAEANETWKLTIAATGKRVSNLDTATITRSEFRRAVSRDGTLTRLFGRDGPGSFRQLDSDENSRVTRSEFTSFLKFPSLRRGRVPSFGVPFRNCMDAFDSIERGIAHGGDGVY
jgi:exonuclease VII small subunit